MSTEKTWLMWAELKIQNTYYMFSHIVLVIRSGAFGVFTRNPAIQEKGHPLSGGHFSFYKS